MRALALVALALLTLFTVAAVFNRIAPYPPDDLIGNKLNFFAENKDDYDLLIIGSSRILAGVMPREIEAAMAAQGVNISAFNLAMNAMGSHEADSILRKVLALKPKRLRFVLAELDYWDGSLRPKKRFRQRTFLWHDAKASYAAARSAYIFARPHQKWERIESHLLHFGGYATALGRGPTVATKLLKPNQGHGLWPKLIKSQGYLEPGWCSPDDLTRFSRACGAKSGDDQLAFYERRLRVMARRANKPVTRQVIDQQALRLRSAILEQAGIVPIHLIPPRLKPTKDLWQLQEQGIIEHLLAFNDTVAYPDLYVLESRCDCDHLSRPGAEKFSALVADRLVEIVSDSPPKNVAELRQ